MQNDFNASADKSERGSKRHMIDEGFKRTGGIGGHGFDSHHMSCTIGSISHHTPAMQSALESYLSVHDEVAELVELFTLEGLCE